MKRSHGLRGIRQRPSGKWQAMIGINGRKQNLGSFGTKEQAAAAYDSAARLYHGVNAVCNYDGPEDAALAISAAIEYTVLLHAGELELIMEGFGPAQHKEALRQVARLIRSGTWERAVAADNLRKAEKTQQQRREQRKKQRREQRC